MGKINVLSFEIANLIAAGEVVERPSSVLKELIENSIDAGATEIVAEIKRGGVALIRVTDNGCGIDRDDLPVSLQRHATSKIQNRDDLDSIMTLGFRGEALAAISSVSEVTIITKTAEAQTAYMLTSEGGKIVDISEVGAADGTTVVVENLFYNVPARRKFLKKDSTEAMNVAALVEKVALSRPDISIQLLVDGEEKFKTPGDGKLLTTIRAIFGKDFASKLIEAKGEADGIKVWGYIGRSDNVRKNRNLENIFINGRYVKSLTAQAALEKAYTSYIATECFPCCALFIEMNPSIVDVNVHPAKLEVKFSDERRVFEAVYYTVKNALEDTEYRPEMTLGAKKSDYNAAAAFVPIGADTKGTQIKMPSVDYAPARERISYGSSAPRNTEAARNDGYGRSVAFSSGTRDASDIGAMSSRDSMDLLARYSNAKPEVPVSAPREINAPHKAERELGETDTEASAIPEYKLVGEAFNCYLILEMDKELLIIDKHAAHERIIFEDLKRGRNEDENVASQKLLLPITVVMTPDEAAAANDCRIDFESVGFEFEIHDRSVDILAIPNLIAPSDAEALFVSMLGEIISGAGNPQNSEDLRRERALYQVACKAAIKGGREYDRSVVDWLIARVLALPDITVCPHGRPIAYKLKKSELDRQFDRLK